MGKSTIIGMIVAAVVIVGGAFVFMNMNKDDADKTGTTTSSNTSTTTNTAPTEQEPANEPSDDSSVGEAVTIQNMAFSPTAITVKKGTTVTWTNQDAVGHDVMPDQDYGTAFEASDGLLGRGESYSFTFNEPGTYSYHCTPHPQMKATVTVTE